MKNLHSNQKLILEHLLNYSNGVTLEELAEYLQLSKTATKEHILRLESLGYITFEDLRQGVGRPKRKYQLSPDGHEVFPRQYSWLSTELLNFLGEELGRNRLRKMMSSLAKKVASDLKRRLRDLKSSPDLFREIVKIMNELGYRAVLKQSDIRKGVIVEATNCVYHSVAKQRPELCQFDIELLQQTSGQKVNLEQCIARGGNVCRFCFEKN